MPLMTSIHLLFLRETAFISAALAIAVMQRTCPDFMVILMFLLIVFTLPRPASSVLTSKGVNFEGNKRKSFLFRMISISEFYPPLVEESSMVNLDFSLCVVAHLAELCSNCKTRLVAYSTLLLISDSCGSFLQFKLSWLSDNISRIQQMP